LVVEVGEGRVRLSAGDSLLAPQRVRHVWAFVGSGRGRVEAFFREVTKANVMPPSIPELWRAHGMELVGPPLALD